MGIRRACALGHMLECGVSEHVPRIAGKGRSLWEPRVCQASVRPWMRPSGPPSGRGRRS